MSKALIKASAEDAAVKGMKCLCRVDYNVPLKGSIIADDTRIKASLPTVRYLVENDARVILMSHLGRPGGKIVDGLRLDPVARRLSELLGKDVLKLDDCTGTQVEASVLRMKPGDVVLLENLRFHPEEEKNDPGFAQALASLGDVYINDAFGTAHRAHASTAGVAAFLPAYAGFLMRKEIAALSKLLTEPARPFVALIGGAKVSDKLGILSNLLDTVDSLLIGGGMANTFLLAEGYEVGNSLCEPGLVQDARAVVDKARQLGKSLLLPEDAVLASQPRQGLDAHVAPVRQIPAALMALDIGPATCKTFRAALSGAGTIFWNGPMGVFEIEDFRRGTMEMAAAVAASQGFTVVGGGDSIAAVEMSGLAGRISHLSTGGGASLEFLEGKDLPGVAVLKDKR